MQAIYNLKVERGRDNGKQQPSHNEAEGRVKHGHPRVSPQE